GAGRRRTRTAPGPRPGRSPVPPPGGEARRPAPAARRPGGPPAPAPRRRRTPGPPPGRRARRRPGSWLLPRGVAALLDDVVALVGGDAVEALPHAARPGDLDPVDLRPVAQAEVERPRRLGQVAAARLHLAGEDLVPLVQAD